MYKYKFGHAPLEETGELQVFAQDCVEWSNKSAVPVRRSGDSLADAISCSHTCRQQSERLRVASHLRWSGCSPHATPYREVSRTADGGGYPRQLNPRPVTLVEG